MEEKMPLVSIIMSVYNEERYIQESLDSVLSQTLDNFELIIIDDCSTDKTTEMIEGYHDSRIRLYRNKKNQGLTKNLNNALRYCRGDILPEWMAMISAFRKGWKNKYSTWKNIRKKC